MCFLNNYFRSLSCYTTIYCHPSMKLSCLSLCSGPVQCDHCPWCIGTIQGPPPVQGSCPTPAARLTTRPHPWLPSVQCPSPAPGYVQTCSTWASAYKNLPPPQDMVKLIHYEAFLLKCFRFIKKNISYSEIPFKSFQYAFIFSLWKQHPIWSIASSVKIHEDTLIPAGL